LCSNNSALSIAKDSHQTLQLLSFHYFRRLPAKVLELNSTEDEEKQDEIKDWFESHECPLLSETGQRLDKKKIYVGPFSKNDKETLASIKTMSDYVIKKKGDPEEEQQKFEEREAKKSKYHQVSDSICQLILESGIFGKRVSVSTVSRAISEAALRAKRSEVEKLLKKPSEELWQEFADKNYDNIVDIIRTIKFRNAINSAARKAKKDAESEADSDQDQDQDQDNESDQDQEQTEQENEHEVTDQEETDQEEEEPPKKRKTRSSSKTKKTKTITKTGISDEELEHALSDSIEF
jgi:hypothetical protein